MLDISATAARLSTVFFTNTDEVEKPRVRKKYSDNIVVEFTVHSAWVVSRAHERGGLLHRGRVSAIAAGTMQWRWGALRNGRVQCCWCGPNLSTTWWKYNSLNKVRKFNDVQSPALFYEMMTASSHWLFHVLRNNGRDVYLISRIVSSVPHLVVCYGLTQHLLMRYER